MLSSSFAIMWYYNNKIKTSSVHLTGSYLLVRVALIFKFKYFWSKTVSISDSGFTRRRRRDILQVKLIKWRRMAETTFYCTEYVNPELKMFQIEYLNQVRRFRFTFKSFELRLTDPPSRKLISFHLLTELG